MSERLIPHNGRDTDGRYRVRATDVDDLITEPDGIMYFEDDIRLGGAVADTGPNAVRLALHLQHLIDNNRIDVEHLVERDRNGNGSSTGNGVSRGTSNHRAGQRAERGYGRL